MVYSRDARRALEALLRDFMPDVAHIHNIYHHLSPSLLVTLRRHNIPVVQTLHDYKRMCPNHAMFTQGSVCERCKGGKYWNAVRYKCIFDSRRASAVVATEMTIQRLSGWYDNYIDFFITPSRFMKIKLKEWGRTSANVMVIPLFVSSIPPTVPPHGKHVLYVGRLSPEKGVDMIVDAAGKMPHITFDIVGEGPQRGVLERSAKKFRNVVFHGFRTSREINDIASDAACVVLPARWYENYPLSLLEMGAKGKALIGSHIGGIPEIIEDGVTGALIEPNNISDLVKKIAWVLTDSRAKTLGSACRRRILQNNAPSVILPQIEKIYQKAIAKHSSKY